MNQLANIIPVILVDKGEVTIPGVGIFNGGKNTGELVSFKAINAPDDEFLVKEIALILTVSPEEAKKLLVQFLNDINNAPAEGISIPKVGILKKENNTFTFMPAKSPLKPTPEKPATADPVAPKSTSQTKPSAPKKSSNKVWWVSFVVLLLLCGGLFLYLNVEISESEDAPIIIGSDKADTHESPEEASTDEQPIASEQLQETPVLAVPEVEAAGYTEFFLIAGSFKQLDNAMELKIKLESKGLKPVIKLFDNGYYRVIIETHRNRNKAIESMNSLNANHGNGFVWMLSQN